MSADELDAELLAMAGDSSDDEGDDYDQTEVFHDRSPSQEAQETVEKVEDTGSSRRGVAQKVKARSRARRRQASEDELSQGEATPSDSEADIASPPTRRHMNDDDDDAPGDLDEEGAPLFPLEGKFHDAADRQHIMSLPELQREEILAERAQTLLRRRQNLQLKKALANQESANKHKRKANAAELEDNSRRSTRPRTDKRSALDDYKRAREQKDAERHRLESNRDRKIDTAQDSASDQDAEGESEPEWAEPTSTTRRDEPPAELKDFDRCHIGRSAFAKICFYPNFEDEIRGCFARLSVGFNQQTGQVDYRMAQIKGFTTGKPYELETAAGKKFLTDQYALVAQGASEKPWPFHACSNSKFTEAEFARYSELLRKDNIRLPSRKYLAARVEGIHRVFNIVFTEDTLQQKFAKQREIEQKYDPANAARLIRHAIEKRREAAELDNDTEELAKCDAELAALDLNGSSDAMSRPRPSPVTKNSHASQDRFAQLNHKNRSRNVEEVRRALLEEKRKLKRDREQAMAKRVAEAQLSRQATDQKPTSKLGDRLTVQDKKDLFGESPGTSRATTPMNGNHTPNPLSRASTPMDGAKVKAAAPLGALKKKVLDDDVIGSLDLGIDIDI